MAYAPTHLRRWTMPDSYFGAVWPDYYAFLGQSRDSSSLERSNFACGLRELGGEDGDETIVVVRESHWAVGWVEWIAIHQDNESALRKADAMAEKLEDYPVLNEDDWSELESSEMTEFWSGMSTRERADYVMGEVKRYHWLKPSLMRFRRLLRAGYFPGSEDGLSRDESMVSRALEESLRN